jgi:hypothetical protein
MEVGVLCEGMVQTNRDHGQKQGVGCFKRAGGIILEFDKKECLMSLLECWDQVVRWNNLWRSKVIIHCTGSPLSKLLSSSMGPWSSSIILSTPISPLVGIVGVFSSLLISHQRMARWRKQTKISPYVVIPVKWTLVVLYHIGCVAQSEWVARDID